MASPPLARIIAGCYEEMIVGYDVLNAGEEENGNVFENGMNSGVEGQKNSTVDPPTPKVRLKLSFTDHPHSGSVRCIAASKGGMVASGSNDETIHVYNANLGRDVGSLMSHGGSVTSLQFHGAKYLISGGEDNNVVVWRTKPKWDVVKTLRGHKGHVESVAVHPSGKIALSTGKDRTLKTWNLIKGRSAYVTNIKQEGSLVCWSPSGKYYALVVGASGLRVYEVATAAIVFSHDHKRRINALRFLEGVTDDDLILFGGEGKEMNLVSVKEARVKASFDAHETRIRDLVEVEIPQDFPATPNSRWIATASNDGWIKLWSLNISDGSESCHLLYEINSGLRISCLCSFTKRKTGPEAGLGKRKTGDNDNDGDESEKKSNGQERNEDARKDTKSSEGKKVKFS